MLKVFRIHTNLEAVIDYVVNEKGYAEVQCINTNYRLFVANRKTTPKWKSFLNAITREEASYSNITASFVLMRPMGESSAYVVTGGFGTYAIQPFIDSDFGLDVLARLVDPESVRIIRQQAISGNLLQEERVFKRPQNFTTDPLGWLKIPRQILAQVKKKDLAEALGLERDDSRPMNLEGTQGFTVRRSVSFEELDVMLTRLDGLMAKNPQIDFMKGCVEVKSRGDRESLLGELSRRLNEIYRTCISGTEDFDDNSIIVTSDDAREWLLCDEYQVELGVKRATRTQLELRDLLSVFKEWELCDVPDLAKVRVTGVDAQGGTRIAGSLLEFVMAEVIHQDQSYVLIDRKWYRTTSDFTSYLDDIIERFIIDDSRYNLPSWPLDTGEVISENEFIVEELGQVSGITVFHKDHVHVAAGKAELCDAFDMRDERHRLVFIKRGINAKSRELARQAVDSLLLVTGHTEFQEKAVEKMRTKGLDTIEPNYPFDKCGVVLAIVDESTHTARLMKPLLQRMRAIAKIEFAYALESLRLRVDGDVWLYEIRHCVQDQLSAGTASQVATVPNEQLVSGG